jgi:segregation and condensation protein B
MSRERDFLKLSDIVDTESMSLSTERALRLTEAIIFASDRPVSLSRIQAAIDPGIRAEDIIIEVKRQFLGRAVSLIESAGGYVFRTMEDVAPDIRRLITAPRRIPKSAMEVLSIIAYHQPCTRGEVEEIRGAAMSQSTIDVLLELALICPSGHREVQGRPTLWATTPRFLEQFCLRSISDLPKREELLRDDGPA